MNQRFVIVGSGPAGLEAARSYREHGGAGAVTILSEDEHPPYARPPLSKEFLRGTLPGSELDLEDQDFYAGREVELVLGTTVTGLDPARRTVTTSDGRVLPYDACLLATGGSPNRPEVPGVEKAGLLRSRAHATELVTRAGTAASAVVVGSGFIGCEAAASLALRGLSVTMVSQESAPQHERLGEDVAARIGSWLDDLGVRYVGGAGLAAVEDEPSAVLLDDGRRIAADLVLVGAGITPNAELAGPAGARLEQGRVVVDEHMRTGVDGVWAAGDVVNARNLAAGRSLSVEHWGEAERMGEVAGADIAGAEDSWAQVPGFWTQIGDHTMKYAAWGDGYDRVALDDGGDGSFTAWYGSSGAVVGVLTHDRDDDYERGAELVEEGAPWLSTRAVP